MTLNSDLPVYAYRFDWGTLDSNGVSVLPKDLGRNVGAHHASEVPFFLGMGMGSISMLLGKTHTKHNQIGREKLSDLCMNYLANFARFGNPNGENLPNWSSWDKAEGKNKILVLNANIEELKLSYLTDMITVQNVLDLINSELKEPELSMILSDLNETIPFGINKLNE